MFLSGVNSMPEQVIKGDLDLLQLIWGIAVSILAFIFSKLMWYAGSDTTAIGLVFADNLRHL